MKLSLSLSLHLCLCLSMEGCGKGKGSGGKKVIRYSGALFESFDTYEEAIEMWEKHLAAVGDAKPIPHHPRNDVGSSSGGGDGTVVEDNRRSKTESFVEAFIVGLLIGLSMSMKHK
ncbi:hypothetical protein RIF29_10496 [Crotalaria pallida]|uniref:Uncharacterized protein n=1 Tax=Crotalaria pallida TaxID=3830 RepID=A0AAN9IK30_CROPI